MRAFEVASRQPWLIRAETLDTILDICSRDNVITAEVIDKIDARREAVAVQRGRAMDDTRYTTRREGGVAVININGPIVRYADMFTEISGGTATQHLATDFQAALSDPSVLAIVLNIDSPGGEATGIHELANIIFEARGKKPVIAYAEGFAASAAYWIASAADQIVTDATAMLGSIGTVFSVPDPTKESKRRIDIVSTQSPKKRPDVTTESGRSELQRWADELTNVFISSVARNRGVSEDVVLSDFGQGGLRIGADAVVHKMADRLGSLESLISELSKQSNGLSRVATAPPKTKENSMFTAEFKKSIGLPETATDDQVNAKIAEMKASAARTDAAEKESKKTTANAQVDAWEREGKISGNATAKVRVLFVAVATGEKVTMEMVSEMVAALPKLDTPRLAEHAKKPELTADVTVTLDDFAKSATNPEAAKRISTALAVRQKTNPKFTRNELYRELKEGTPAK